MDKTNTLLVLAIFCLPATVPAQKTAGVEKSFLTSQTNKTMPGKNFTTSFKVDRSPNEVFDAVTRVREWWSENIEGNTDHLNAEFIYAYKDVHQCKMKITGFVPGKKVVWRVLENQFNFTKNKEEWKDNTIVFEIEEKDNGTQLTFTQIGLVPDYECYRVCQDAWTAYITGSLKSLIETGQGKPNTKEHDLNKELVRKWGLPKN